MKHPVILKNYRIKLAAIKSKNISTQRLFELFKFSIVIDNMKTLLTLLSLCFFGAQSFADCSMSGIRVWPQIETISENPVIYVEGYASDQATVRKIGENYALYLSSPDHVVRLEVIETLEGGMYLTQIMLKPLESLKEAVEYELHLFSIPKSPTDLPVSLDLNFPSQKWTIKPLKDETIPVFKSTPKWIKSTYIEYGCGNASSMEFEFETEEKITFLVRTTVINMADTSQSTYYIPANEIISIGYHKCSGAFRLKTGIKYKIEFSLLDDSWNKGKTVSSELVYEPENGN